MTRDLRMTLKQAVDAAIRERVAASGQPTCKGCGCEMDIYLVGCRQCDWRKWNRIRRGVPV